MLETLAQKPIVKMILIFTQKYEHHMAVVALVGGFVFDTLTLTRPGALFGNVVLGGYLLVSAGCILALSLYGRRQKVAPLLILFLLQFCFGNLAGGLLVLYGKSGTFEGSILFFLVFGIFIAINEFFRKRYALLVFHMGAWFFLMLGYTALIVPVIVRKMGDEIFLVSVAVSLGAVAILLLFVYLLSPVRLWVLKKQIGAAVGGLTLFFIGLYFANVIPPVPLSLQHIGVYHSIIRTANGYESTFERPLWYEFFRETSKTFVLGENPVAYCFGAIFAPAWLATPIHHHWEEYDVAEKEWRTRNIISFVIAGGREEGFRGYSEKDGIRPGRWRCSVETERGALIGRTTFTVVPGAPVLSKAVL